MTWPWKEPGILLTILLYLYIYHIIVWDLNSQLKRFHKPIQFAWVHYCQLSQWGYPHTCRNLSQIGWKWTILCYFNKQIEIYYRNKLTLKSLNSCTIQLEEPMIMNLLFKAIIPWEGFWPVFRSYTSKMLFWVTYILTKFNK